MGVCVRLLDGCICTVCVCYICVSLCVSVSACMCFTYCCVFRCAVIYCCVTALTMCFLCVCVCVRVCFVHVLSVLGLCMCVCVHVCLHACVSALIVCNYWFSVGPRLPASAPSLRPQLKLITLPERVRACTRVREHFDARRVPRWMCHRCFLWAFGDFKASREASPGNYRRATPPRERGPGTAEAHHRNGPLPAPGEPRVTLRLPSRLEKNCLLYLSH